MLRFLFAGLLALSLGIKVASGFSTGIQAAALSDPALAREGAAVAKFLERSGFTVEEWQGAGPVRLVLARAGECRVLMGALSPLSWHRDLLHRLAPAGGRAFFVYGGGIYDDQPKMMAWIDYFFINIYKQLGMIVSAKILHGVVTTAECSTNRTDWRSADPAIRPKIDM